MTQLCFQSISPVMPPKDGFDFAGFERAAEAMSAMGRAARGLTSEITGKVGAWFCGKWRGRAHEVGHRAAATQMRKQGIPLDQALLILFGVEERFTHLRGT